ncbi:Lrp/AsnC family transcriptional regulator [Halobacteriales archaeon QS_4_69_34]|nr:MAG: Lrp/AsnC family transcriptional regulator [Halobacteriales archaeon QS_4_69_34]
MNGRDEDASSRDDGGDRAELRALLSENARHSIADLARLADMDEAAVEATIEELESEGVIRGYQAVVDPSRVEPEPVRALVECNVTLDRETGYDDIAARLVEFPEANSLRLVSGDYDFALEVEGDSMSEVSRFIAEKVAPVPEITQTVTHYIMDTYKERGIEMSDGHEDDRLSVSP